MHRQTTTIGLSLLGTILAVCVASPRDREPLYAGKTVTQWLDAGYEDCATALHEIGPPALPYIRTSFSRTEQARVLWPNWNRRRCDFLNLFRKAPACNLDENRVCSLILELGPGTIPMLAHDLDNDHANVRKVSARVLSLWHDQGKDIRSAVPRLKQALTDPHPGVREWAAYALHMGSHSAVDGGNARPSGLRE